MPDIPFSVALTIVGIVVTLLITRYGMMKSDFDERSKTASRVQALETSQKITDKIADKVDKLCVSVAVLESKDDKFWKLLGPRFADIGHSPIHVRRDELMHKLSYTLDITYAELLELRPMLDEAANDTNGETTKRLALAYALYRVDTLLEREEKLNC